MTATRAPSALRDPAACDTQPPRRATRATRAPRDPSAAHADRAGWAGYAGRRREECAALVDGVFADLISLIEAGDTRGVVAAAMFDADQGHGGTGVALANLLALAAGRGNCVQPAVSHTRAARITYLARSDWPPPPAS